MQLPYDMHVSENRQDASDKRIVNVSTIFGAAMTLGSFVVAPLLQHIDGIFSFQQHVMLGKRKINMPFGTMAMAWLWHGNDKAMKAVTWLWHGNDMAMTRR